MKSTDSLPPPTVASSPRRVLHTLIALAGWVLFVWWWILVFRRVSPYDVRLTVLFIAIALAVCVLATSAWVFHNLSIHNRKGPRTSVREVSPDFSRDVLGRRVAFASSDGELGAAPVVRVAVQADQKTYRAVAFPGAAPSLGSAPDPLEPPPAA